MASATLPVAAVSRPAINPWFVAVAVIVPTFMEVLDTTIANVALRYIAGGLSTAVTDSEWVITSYLAANAVILPISGWLAAHFGRRNYFLLSIAVFTLASALCGLATSLGQIILFRVLQGLAGGGLQPSSQGVLLDSFPPEKQGAAQTVFGIAALIRPIVGPTVGGWLFVNFRVLGERNLAISCVVLFCTYAVLYASSFSLPAMLQALFGYDALQAGRVLSPGGITSVSALVVAGFLLGRGLDARWLIAAG